MRHEWPGFDRPTVPQGVLDLLNKKQEAAVMWLWVGSERPWYSAPYGASPAAATMGVLVRLRIATKRGGDGFAAFYSMTSFGRSVRAELDKRLAEKAAMQKILDEMAGS